MAAEDVIARLRVEGEGAFSQAFGRARDSIRGVSRESEEGERDMRSTGRALIGAAGAAVVARKGYQGLKDAVNTTGDLARSTAAFSRASGLSREESQQWVTVAKSRGIETQQLQMGMAAFGRQLGATDAEGEAASKTLAQLGVDQKALLAMPMADRMQHVAQAFSNMADGPEKAAAAQRLFGRSGQQLLPILNSGAEGLRGNLDAANRLVPALGKTGEDSLELAAKQREMQMAMLGLKTTVGTALIPIIVALARVIMPVVGAFSRLIQTSPLVTRAIVVLGLAIAALVIGVKLAALAKLAWAGATMIAAGALAVLTSPITLVVLAIAALVAAIVAAAILIVRNWDTIKAAFGAAKDFVVARVNDIAGFVGSLPGRIGSALGGLAGIIAKPFRDGFEWAKNAARDALNWIIDQINRAIEQINKLIRLANKVPGVNIGEIGDIGHAQAGAVALGGRNLLVGERGPEVLSLPSGSRISPLPPPALAASQLGGGGGQPVIAQVFLDRRMIAEAFASYTAERQAAR